MSDRNSASSLPQRAAVGRKLVGSRKKIAVLQPSYNMERVSYLMASSHHDYFWLRRLPLHKLTSKSNFLDQAPVVIGPRVDLVHTFNQLPLNRSFVVSAEMELPRFFGQVKPWQLRWGYERLLSSACRGIWPLSEAAYAYIIRRLEAAGMGSLRDKMTIFRGGIKPAAADRSSYEESGPLKLLFVGGDGLRKGLGPLLNAVERLRAGGVEVEVTVIGDATAETYIVPGTEFETAWIRALLTRPWVRHHLSVPNAEVRRMMGVHDIFVMPTMDESLGWVVAEAALSGTPTITTNIFALPELVLNGESGWTIPVELDVDRRWLHVGKADAREAWDAVQEQLAHSIASIVSQVANDRSLVRRFGEKARVHIGNLYDLSTAGQRLSQLYEEALDVKGPAALRPNSSAAGQPVRRIP